MSRRDEEFREFARSRAAPLHRSAYLLCGDWHLAHDLVRDTLVKAYRHWHRVRDPGADGRRGLDGIVELRPPDGRDDRGRSNPFHDRRTGPDLECRVRNQRRPEEERDRGAQGPRRGSWPVSGHRDQLHHADMRRDEPRRELDPESRDGFP
jgi:hypothetical protein